MKKRNVIYVTLEGGVIQAIDGIPKSTTIVVVDLDIEALEDSETTKWTSESGNEEAYVTFWEQQDGLSPNKARAWYYNLKQKLIYGGRLPWQRQPRRSTKSSESERDTGAAGATCPPKGRVMW